MLFYFYSTHHNTIYQHLDITPIYFVRVHAMKQNNRCNEYLLKKRKHWISLKYLDSFMWQSTCWQHIKYHYIMSRFIRILTVVKKIRVYIYCIVRYKAITNLLVDSTIHKTTQYSKSNVSRWYHYMIRILEFACIQQHIIHYLRCV